MCPAHLVTAPLLRCRGGFCGHGGIPLGDPCGGRQWWWRGWCIDLPLPLQSNHHTYNHPGDVPPWGGGHVIPTQPPSTLCHGCPSPAAPSGPQCGGDGECELQWGLVLAGNWGHPPPLCRGGFHAGGGWGWESGPVWGKGWVGGAHNPLSQCPAHALHPLLPAHSHHPHGHLCGDLVRHGEWGRRRRSSGSITPSVPLLPVLLHPPPPSGTPAPRGAPFE